MQVKSFTVFAGSLAIFFLAISSAPAQQSQDSKSIDLFQTKNFEAFEFHFAEPQTRGTDIFSFDSQGVLHCKGKPFGYIATKKEYKNLKLRLEYRWPEGEKPTNSGVFLRINEQPKESFLPRGIETQLAHSSAGDLWAFHGMKIDGAGKRGISTANPDLGPMSGAKRIEEAELAPGQWNTVEVLLEEGLLVVVLNGKIVNWATNVEIKSGKVGLQSEGGPVRFRNFVLTPLPEKPGN